MSVLLAREDEENNKVLNNKVAVNSPLLAGQKVKSENIHDKIIIKVCVLILQNTHYACVARACLELIESNDSLKRIYHAFKSL